MVLEYLNKNYNLSTKSNSIKDTDGLCFSSRINENYIKKNDVRSENNLLIFDNETKAYFAENEKHCYVFIDGQTFTFTKIDGNFDYFDVNSDSSNQNIIKSPMPGSVVSVLVTEGQKVEEGTPIIIVSAMKMETTLYSSICGVITEINAAKGEQIDENIALVVIIKEEE